MQTKRSCADGGEDLPSRKTSIMKIDINVANVAFGHLARTGMRAISDVFTDVIESVPQEPQARARYLQRVSSAERAEFFVCRAYKRMQAAGEAAQPHLGKPFSLEYAEAANAADLLIAADLAMAILLKPSLRRTATMTSILDRFIPSGRRPVGDHVFEWTGEANDADAIMALNNGIDPVTQTELAAWHGKVLGESFAAPAGEGFLAEVAFLRQELFETYLDRDTELDEETPPSCGAIVAAGYAFIFAGELQIRAENRRKRVKLS